MAFFCTKTGVRIAAPGVSKSVDPESGHDEVVEVEGAVVAAKAAKGKSPKPDPKGDDKAPDAKSEQPPVTGGEGDGAKDDKSAQGAPTKK